MTKFTLLPVIVKVVNEYCGIDSHKVVIGKTLTIGTYYIAEHDSKAVGLKKGDKFIIRLINNSR